MNPFHSPLSTAVAAAALLHASCASDSSTASAENPVETQAPELIGRIASVPADGGFVLIQKLGAKELPGGTVLTSRGTEDRAANLLVTGESLGQFAAADVRTGHVQVGDGVYSHHSPAPQPTPETTGENTEGIENKIVTEDESVQKNN